MTIEPLVTQTIPPANPFLQVVKTYLELISGEGNLTYGSGLKRLYALSSGVATLNDRDIEDITAKAERHGMLPGNLRGFMHQAISKNLYLYGQELQRIIADRIVGIANGDIKSPPSFITFNADEARRTYYSPPPTFLVSLGKAVKNDSLFSDWNYGVSVTTFEDLANDVEYLLNRIQGEEGYSSPVPTAWAVVMKHTDALIEVLHTDIIHSNHAATYKGRSRSAVKILWFIAKLLTGDLTVKPATRDTNLVDLDQVLRMSDGTLAAIPFPLKQTMEVFVDEEMEGISMKARFYLSAVSAASFYRQSECDEG